MFKEAKQAYIVRRIDRSISYTADLLKEAEVIAVATCVPNSCLHDGDDAFFEAMESDPCKKLAVGHFPKRCSVLTN